MSNDMHCFRDDHAVYREVAHARLKAHEKHGENSIEVEPATSPRWLAILVEEIGEVANALTYDGKGDLRAELIDGLAVMSAWIDAIDRDRTPTLVTSEALMFAEKAGIPWPEERPYEQTLSDGDGDLG